MYDNDEHETVAKTLWSETLIEVLCVALSKNKGDEQIIKILTDIRAKGFKDPYVISKVRNDIDNAAASRVKALLRKA